MSARDKIATEESVGSTEGRHEAAGGDITGIAEPKKSKPKKKKKKAAMTAVGASQGGSSAAETATVSSVIETPPGIEENQSAEHVP